MQKQQSSARRVPEPSTKPAAGSPSTPAHRSPQLPSSTPAAESALPHSWPDADSYSQSPPAPRSAAPSKVLPRPRLPQKLRLRLIQQPHAPEPPQTTKPPPPA